MQTSRCLHQHLNRKVILRLAGRIRELQAIDRYTLGALVLVLSSVQFSIGAPRAHPALSQLRNFDLWHYVHMALIQAPRDPLLARLACRLTYILRSLGHSPPTNGLEIESRVTMNLVALICGDLSMRRAACEAMVVSSQLQSGALEPELSAAWIHALLTSVLVEMEGNLATYPEATIGLLSVFRLNVFRFENRAGGDIFLYVRPLIFGTYLGQAIGLRIIYDLLQHQKLRHLPKVFADPPAESDILRRGCFLSLSWLLIHACADVSRMAVASLRILCRHKYLISVPVVREGCVPILWSIACELDEFARPTAMSAAQDLLDYVRNDFTSTSPSTIQQDFQLFRATISEVCFSLILKNRPPQIDPRSLRYFDL